MSDSMIARNLGDIGRHYGSDKFTSHRFTLPYENHFEKIRNKSLKIMEIGVGEENSALGGASLLAWREYFPNASIIGLDIYDKSDLDQDRILTVIGDQGDATFLRELSISKGPFDIIIDDGSHMGSDVNTSLFSLLPLLNHGGWYVIEDIQTSYWANYGGSSFAPMCCDTPVRWLKLLVDIINSDEILDDEYFPLSAGFDVAELHVYHNIAFIRKAEINEDLRSRVLRPRVRKEFKNYDQERNGNRKEVHQLLFSDPGKLAALIDSVVAAGGIENSIEILANTYSLES